MVTFVVIDAPASRCRANAAILANAMARVRPRVDRAGLETSAFLIVYLGEATMRLAVSEGRREPGRRARGS